MLGLNYTDSLNTFRNFKPEVGIPQTHKMGTDTIDTLSYGFVSDAHNTHAEIIEEGINENTNFSYTIFSPNLTIKYDKAIVLIHGLNEKSWTKYYPWAAKLALELNRPVILFPIAYHMNRIPSLWTDESYMRESSNDRGIRLENKLNSPFNATISQRLDDQPERFYSSGLQTYYDILALAKTIKAGIHPQFSEATHIDFFGYSIGATLSELLIMSDEENLFDDTKAFLFCGGSILNQTNASSKGIIDSKSFQSLLGFFNRISQKNISNNPILRKLIFKEDNKAKFYFRSFLDYYCLKPERDNRLAEIGKRIKALALTRDKVFPLESIKKVLGSCTEETDFNYLYKHEMPFPFFPQDHEKVDLAFNSVFEKAALHLS